MHRTDGLLDHIFEFMAIGYVTCYRCLMFPFTRKSWIPWDAIWIQFTITDKICCDNAFTHYHTPTYTRTHITVTTHIKHCEPNVMSTNYLLVTVVANLVIEVLE